MLGLGDGADGGEGGGAGGGRAEINVNWSYGMAGWIYITRPEQQFRPYNNSNGIYMVQWADLLSSVKAID